MIINGNNLILAPVFKRCDCTSISSCECINSNIFFCRLYKIIADYYLSASKSVCVGNCYEDRNNKQIFNIF